MKASRDSAQETLNDIREEWALCPDGPQTKEKRKCYNVKSGLIHS